MDRANCRHKFDDRKQISNDFSVPVRRVKADIADIDLANEELKLSEFGQIVASSKHLCGAGTGNIVVYLLILNIFNLYF